MSTDKEVFDLVGELETYCKRGFTDSERKTMSLAVAAEPLVFKLIIAYKKAIALGADEPELSTAIQQAVAAGMRAVELATIIQVSEPNATVQNIMRNLP